MNLWALLEDCHNFNLSRETISFPLIYIYTLDNKNQLKVYENVLRLLIIEIVHLGLLTPASTVLWQQLSYIFTSIRSFLYFITIRLFLRDLQNQFFCFFHSNIYILSLELHQHYPSYHLSVHSIRSSLYTPMSLRSTAGPPVPDGLAGKPTIFSTHFYTTNSAALLPGA